MFYKGRALGSPAILADVTLVFILCGWTLGGEAPPAKPLPPPDCANVAYGPHERNVLDLWKAPSKTPTPLVIYFPGGGFQTSDKRKLLPQLGLVNELTQAGISVAAANYRYSTQAPFPAPMLDSARAVQFLRFKARELNLDPRRFGATGESAGGGISLWLAFHDDLADPRSADPVARESTRLACAYVMSAQCSYDPRFNRTLFPGDGWKHPYLAALFGMTPQDYARCEAAPPEKLRLFEEASPIGHVSAGDPPVVLAYAARPPLTESTPAGVAMHHPAFGDALKRQMDALKIECTVRCDEAMFNPQPRLDFLNRRLLGPE